MGFEASTKIFKVVELHCKAIANIVSSPYAFTFGVGLLAMEALWLILLQVSTMSVLAVGNRMTLRELRNPWLFTKQLVGRQYVIRKFVSTNFRKSASSKVRSKYFFAFKHAQSLVQLISNNLKFFLLCRDLRGAQQIHSSPEANPFRKVVDASEDSDL